MSEKPRLFLSHIHEEAALARVLQKWTEDSFPGQCTVFVSSDDKSIKKGSKWLDEIGNALTEARALVVLCSPNSLQRPWINFETGFGYARKLPVFPVCHSGQRLGTLPRPLGDFHGFEIGRDVKFCNDFLAGIAEPLGFPKALPIDGAKMMAEITKALPKYGREQAGRAQSVDKDSGETLEPECEKILELARHMEKFTTNDAASCLGMHWDKPDQKQDVMYFMEVLFDEKLIEGTGMQNILDDTWTAWPEFRLSSKGRKRMHVRRRRKSNAEHS